MKSTTLLLALLPFTLATKVDFYSDRSCSLGLVVLDIPSEAGCTTLPNGDTALSVNVPNSMATDCAIELYADDSCNTLQSILDWGVDDGEQCTVANQGFKAYISLCGLGDSKRLTRRKKLSAA